MIIDQISTTSYLQSLLDFDFDAALNSHDGRVAVAELLNDTVLRGGKRLRPLLTVLFGELAGVKKPQLQILAKAIEHVHAASLAHDDVIDGASTRRGKPSINVAGDNKKAILAGDFLLAQVINDLSSLENIEVVNEMAKIIKRLSIGEWIQHDCVKLRKYDEKVFYDISKNKTSSVLEWCSVSPFLYGNYPERVVKTAQEFGENLGLCFQLYDDILDFSDDSSKDKFLDVKNDQLTFITYRYLVSKGLLESYERGASVESLLVEKELGPTINEVRSIADGYHAICLKKLEELVTTLQIPKKDKNLQGILYLLGKLKDRKK